MVVLLSTVAALLASAWLAVTAWLLLADRSRGRPRCPKCFFSMDGLDVSRCPECGRAIANPQLLYRTRRRWRLAALACIVLLTPALLTGGFARVKQAGPWVDVPTSILVRFQGLESESLHKQLIARVKAHSISRPDARRVARRVAADLGRFDRRQAAYDMLDALAANSYSTRNDDKRPMLCELEPRAVTDALLDRLAGGDTPERVHVLSLLSHVKSADPRATLALATNLGATKAEEWRAAERSLGDRWRVPAGVKHPPGPAPRWIREPSRSGPPGPAAVRLTAHWLGSRLADCADPALAIAIARRIALGELTPAASEGDGDLARAAGLWLWCRFDRTDPECLAALASFMDSPNPSLRLTAVEQLGAFDWSDDVAHVLRTALADPDPSSDVQFRATLVIGGFSRQAQPLVPDMLAYAQLPKRGASSDFPEEFVAAGGRPEELLALILDRLARARRQVVSPTPGEAPIELAFDFRWVADLGLRDAAGAETVRWFVEECPPSAYTGQCEPPYAVLAYAVLTGDREFATRAALARDPDMTSGPVIGSIEEVLFELCRRDLADDQLVGDHYARISDPKQRLGFLEMLSNLPKQRLQAYQSVIQTLQTDPDPTLAAKAAAQLERLAEAPSD